MIEDLLVALALVVIGDVVLVLAGRGSAVFRVGFAIGPALGIGSPRRTAASIRANPLLRLTLLLSLIVTSGWLATVAQVGVGDTARAIRFERGVSHQARRCEMEQRVVAVNLEVDAHADDDELEPGPLDPRFRYRCPSGAAYVLEPDGSLRCERHGSFGVTVTGIAPGPPPPVPDPPDPAGIDPPPIGGAR